MKLKLADNLSLPLETVTQTIGVLAKRRAGKSYTIRRLAEQLLKAGQQVVVVDPKGDWWGIRSSADGKSPGLPVIMLGGERGDVPLEVGSGEIVAKLAAESRANLILDLSLFRKHEVATFMTAFLENLYRIKARESFRTPMMLVIDEADAIAPQKPQKGEERMLGAAEDIVRRGGQRGIGCILVSQRSAVLNKNVLTQLQILIALRTIAPQDLAALNAWIDVHGTPEQRHVLMESLPSLPVGDAWAWSPGWPTVDGIFQRAHILPIETFDSGATPKPGEARKEPKSVADVDLDLLKEQMAATIAKAKADDPKELRKKIAELEKQLKAKTPAPADPALVERAVERAKLEAATAWEYEKRGYVKQIEQNLKVLKKVAELLGAADPSAMLAERPTLLRQVDNSSASRKPSPQPIPRQPVPPRECKPRTPLENGRLPIGERKTLAALIQFPDGLFREQLTVLTGYKRSSRDAYIQRLREKGYVDFGGKELVATDSGQAALPDAEPLPTGEALQSYWLARLPQGERAVLEILISAYPESVQRAALDEATGYKRSSRDAYLNRLSAKQLVEEAGRSEVKASDNLFE